MREIMRDIMANYMIKRMEEKLMELMGDDYYEFAREVATEGFKKEMEALAESDFKNFVLDNFDEIVK